MPNALPLSQQILLDVIVPPIGAALWRYMVRGWAMGIQGGNVSEQTRRRQRLEFWIILSLAYLVMFGITLYGRLK